MTLARLLSVTGLVATASVIALAGGVLVPTSAQAAGVADLAGPKVSADSSPRVRGDIRGPARGVRVSKARVSKAGTLLTAQVGWNRGLIAAQGRADRFSIRLVAFPARGGAPVVLANRSTSKTPRLVQKVRIVLSKKRAAVLKAADDAVLTVSQQHANPGAYRYARAYVTVTHLPTKKKRSAAAAVRESRSALRKRSGRDCRTRLIGHGAKLAGCDLSAASLRDCVLTRADLSRANLSAALLRGCAMGGAGMAGADLDGVSKLWDTDSWMGDLFSTGTITGPDGKQEDARSVSLQQLAIPGSHDSGAYTTGDWAPECQETNVFQRFFGEGTTRRWARTQHHDTYTQAKLGIRSFDIRPYWDGRTLRTCHTLQTASLRDVFEGTATGESGLAKFVKENPKEVVIVNLSHWYTEKDENKEKYNEGISALVQFMRKNVCTRAVRPSTTQTPGDIELGDAWARKKNYVVLADESNGLYEQLASRLPDCVFNTKYFVSGGYPGEHDSVSYGNGDKSSTNLWRGMLDENVCENHRFVNKHCTYGRGGRENADTVRHASEQILLDQFKGTRRGLHETSYIWVYGTFARVKNFPDMVDFPLIMDEANLIAATEEKVMTVHDVWYLPADRVRAGLYPYAADFIKRLESKADRRPWFNYDTERWEPGTGVNIVNMDAVGRSPGTRDGLINPMMGINHTLLN